MVELVACVLMSFPAICEFVILSCFPSFTPLHILVLLMFVVSLF